MTTPIEIQKQINELIQTLAEIGLSDDQCFAYLEVNSSKTTNVTFEGAEHVGIALKDQSYKLIYNHLVKERVYNLKMLDGALIQMLYRFSGKSLRSHRLAFFPAPNLDQFQNIPDIYEEDAIYADVTARNVIPVPVRFDFDTREEQHHKLLHPKSHLTLGQYKHCRIPVTSPVIPYRFIEFVLRNFYSTGTRQFTDYLNTPDSTFEDTIEDIERSVIHVAVPT